MIFLENSSSMNSSLIRLAFIFVINNCYIRLDTYMLGREGYLCGIDSYPLLWFLYNICPINMKTFQQIEISKNKTSKVFVNYYLFIKS